MTPADRELSQADLALPDIPAGSGRAVGPTPRASESDPGGQRRPSRLWLWFVAAFVVQILVWAAWLTIAARNPVATVPLVQPVLR